MNEAQYQPVEDSFREGRIESEDSATLGAYLHALSNQPVHNELVRHRDIIRGITINHILLQRHIADLDKKNATTQKLVIVLTVASVLTGALQIWYAARADDRAMIEATRTTLTTPAEESRSQATVPVASPVASLPSGGQPRAQKDQLSTLPVPASVASVPSK
jgi:hypothetical protein